MDGSPSRGETIPIRLFLGGFDLTPTFRDVNKKFSTRYYLSLVLIDEDARRYFKQSEIILFRQAPEAATGQPQIVSVPEPTMPKPLPVEG
jgi:vacuolar protein sorting-associated protein 26